MRIGAVLAVVVAFAMLVGCGQSSGPTPSPVATRVPLVGYWQGHAKGGSSYLFRIVHSGSGYAVAVNGWPARAVPLEHSRLVLHRYGQEPSMFTQHLFMPSGGLELAWSHGHVIAVVRGPHGTVARTPLAPISAASYERQNREWADANSGMNGFALWVVVHKWQLRHQGVPPAAAELRPTSAFGKWALTVPGMSRWPVNLYTGTPMHAGTQPGDFTYTTDGHTFKLVEHLTGGKSYVTP